MSNQNFRTRWRVQKKRVKIAEDQGGTIRAAMTAGNRAGLAMFSARDRRKMLVTALEDGAKSFMLNAWPRRFTNYAHTNLKYKYPSKARGAAAAIQPSSSAVRLRLSTRDPLVDTGELGARSITYSRAKAMLGKNPRAVMRFPRPHQLKAKDQAVLERITRSEVQGVAKRVERTLIQLIASGKVSKRAKDGRALRRRMEIPK